MKLDFPTVVLRRRDGDKPAVEMSATVYTYEVGRGWGGFLFVVAGTERNTKAIEELQITEPSLDALFARLIEIATETAKDRGWL